MTKKSPYLLIASALILGGCAGKPQITVDPNSITDTAQYKVDLEECETISKNYKNDEAVGKSAALGAGAAVGTASLVLATGGLYLLPAGVGLAAGGGAAVGGGVSKAQESSAQEKIWAECMNSRGYSAYTGG